MTRRRNDVLFHMTNDGEAGDQKCVCCGGILREPPAGESSMLGAVPPKPDRWSTWDYQAKTKQVGNGRHYVCSWGALLTAVFKAADEGWLR
jgi:hypothetical protein